MTAKKQNQQNSRPYLDFEQIREAAVGNYTNHIFSALGINFSKAPNQHQPCPMCGGKDRFRCDDMGGRGTYICSQCGAGNGIQLIQKCLHLDDYEVHAVIADILGIDTTVKISEEQKKRWAIERGQREEQEHLKKQQLKKQASYDAQKEFSSAAPCINHAYLSKKGVKSHGLRIKSNGDLLIPLYLHNIETGNITLTSVQRISANGEKSYKKDGQKSGAFFTIGDIAKSNIIFVTEGYATGASIYESLDGAHAVIVTFDADNLVKCASIVTALYPHHRIIFAADDDAETAARSTDGKNPGIQAAYNAALATQSEYISPDFGSDDDAKARIADGSLTDYNDLALYRGVEVLKAQLLHAINHQRIITTQAPEITLDVLLKECAQIINDRKGTMTNKIYHEPTLTDYNHTAFKRSFGHELTKQWLEHPNKRTINQTEIDSQRNDNAKRAFGYIFDNYAFITGTKEVFNISENTRQSVESLRLEYPNEFDMWNKSPDRLKVKAANIFFDPTEERGGKLGVPYINTFKGMQLTVFDDSFSDSQIKAMCAPMIQLLTHLCNGNQEYANWALNWLAIPLQKPGTKMDTFLLFHGHVQGAGKSLFFDRVIGRIYGDHMLTLGQGQLESQYNDWIDGKLYVVFEEIFEGKERYSAMGMVKQLTTGKSVFINKKFTSGWRQDNFVNSIFLSNHEQPLTAEEADRRAFVIYPKHSIPNDVRLAVSEALEDPDQVMLRAFYTYLMRKDVGDQNANSHGLMTEDKQQLIELSRSSWERFYNQWKGGMIPHIPYQTCTSQDIFDVYRQWCTYNNERSTTQTRFMSFLGRREHKEVVRFIDRRSNKNGGFTYPVVQATALIINLPAIDESNIARSRQEVYGYEVNKFREAMNYYMPRHD